MVRRLSSLALVVLVAGCAVGPRYERPQTAVPAAFKEAPPGSWKEARPRDALARGGWWRAFGEAELDGLVQKALAANQDLAVAQARLRQAKTLVQQARAGYYPSASAGVQGGRSGDAAGAGNSEQLMLDAQWEIDLWGRVRNAVSARGAIYQASAAEAEAARLSVIAQVMQTYFDLRGVDAQRALLDQTVSAYTQSLQLTKNRHAAGVVDKADVVQAQVQLKTAQGQAIDLGADRAQLEHALAVIVGELPSTFSLAPAPLATAMPSVPVAVPSALLERRPDIAAAERNMAAANAQVGVAQAAFFPSLTLSAQGGLRSTSLADWLTAPSRFWSVGLGVVQFLFDAGARSAQKEQAIAAYEEQLASYHQTVLTAFKEVEDSLSTLRVLEDEAALQTQTVDAAREALRLVTNQYKAGVVGYLNVINAQTSLLASERNAVSLRNRRLDATVALVKALGGGWDAAELPVAP